MWEPFLEGVNLVHPWKTSNTHVSQGNKIHKIQRVNKDTLQQVYLRDP